MKTRTIFMALAASMMFFVACNKDENQPTNNSNNNDDNGGGNTPALGVNELIVDGVKYPMNVQLMNGMNFKATDANGQRFTINGGIQHSELGDNFDITYDLTTFCEGIHFGFSFEGQQFFYLVYDNTGWKVMGALDNTEYDGESMFSSGTATVRYNAQGLYIKIDGTLKNSHTIAFCLSSSPSDPGINPEVTPNGLVIGTQQYQMHPTLSISGEGNYLFGANDPNGHFDIIADVSSTLMNQTVDLTQLSDVAFFYINFNTPDLSFVLQTVQPISVINDEQVNAVFSQGTLQLTKENGMVTLRVSGTLTTGKYVGFMMSVPVTDIEAMDYQIIVDGSAYTAEGLAWHWPGAGLPYEMMLSTEEGQTTVKVEVESLTHHIDLTTTTTAIKYRVTINFWDQDSTATQDAFTGTVESSYWDIEEQASHPVTGCLFTSGSLYVNEDEYAIGFSLTGSLTNGRSVSAQVRISKSEIQDQDI